MCTHPWFFQFYYYKTLKFIIRKITIVEELTLIKTNIENRQKKIKIRLKYTEYDQYRQNNIQIFTIV